MCFCGLGSFLLQDMFLNLPAFAFEGQNKKFTVNMLLTSILYCDAGPGCLIRTPYLSTLPVFRESPSFSSNLPISRLEHQISRELATVAVFTFLIIKLPSVALSTFLIY